MRFGRVPLEEAEGAILAHAVKAADRRFRKAHHLSAGDIQVLREARIAELVVARLDPGDLVEDEAAAAVAASLKLTGIDVRPPATGRVNLHAREAGLFTVEKALVDALNAVDPDVTLATLAAFEPVEAGQMVATVKIIPFAVSERVIGQVAELVEGREAMAVRPFRPRQVALIQTVLPSVKPSVLDKTARLTGERLERFGSKIVGEQRVAHEAGELAGVIAKAAASHDLVLVFGASAVSDEEDVIPAAICMAGGRVERVGMPVDPGNLLVIGAVGGATVIGAPGCARSPKENGFDWILRRVLAGLEVKTAEIADMGVGGLLTEIGTRPSPRDKSTAPEPMVHVVLLAAGRSSRMGGPNKLLARFDGEPLVRRMAERVLASEAASVTVVVGHQADQVKAALEGIETNFAENAAFATGLASSLKAGLAATPPSAAGLLVMLGDMPAVTAADLDRMIVAFRKAKGQAIVRATHAGKRGNPVILPRATFTQVATLDGDTGARAIMEAGRFEVVDVELGEAASLDVDTPEAMALAGGELV